MEAGCLLMSGLLIFTERSRMDDKQIEKTFSYIVIAVIGYFIVKAFFPYLIMAVIGLLVLRHFNHKK
jgi:hypothetical protein